MSSQTWRRKYSKTHPEKAIVAELLTVRDAAYMVFNIGPRNLLRHSRNGSAPMPIRLGGQLRYRLSDLLACLKYGGPEAIREQWRRDRRFLRDAAKLLGRARRSSVVS
jgi:hypothetical protein